jgi:predicted transcriptional regulator of viral defense system
MNQRFQILAKLGEKIFHSSDLARLWGINSKNTLSVTLHRYVKQEYLYRVFKGFYSIMPVKKLDPKLLGIKAMHQFSYISTETVLSEAGIIQQLMPNITIISGKSKRFVINEQSYQCRKLNDAHLYNPVGIQEINGYKLASVTRALADLLYYNKLFHIDNQNPIDWFALNEMQRNIGYPITDRKLAK